MASAAAGSAQTSPQPTAAIDPDALLQAGAYAQMLQEAQRREIDDAGVLTRDSEMWFGIQLLAAALSEQQSDTDNDDTRTVVNQAELRQSILSAKFAWKRIPLELKKKSHDLQLAWKVVSLLLQRDFGSFFSLSGAQSTFASPLLQRMHARLRASVHDRNARALSHAYSVLSAETAAPLLGVSAAEAAAELTKLGWTRVEAAGGAAAAGAGSSPLFQPPAQAQADGKARDISHQQIEQLTTYVAHLEA